MAEGSREPRGPVSPRSVLLGSRTRLRGTLLGDQWTGSDRVAGCHGHHEPDYRYCTITHPILYLIPSTSLYISSILILYLCLVHNISPLTTAVFSTCEVHDV